MGANDDGGTAFPTLDTGAWVKNDGMTLRDYFAAKPLGAMAELALRTSKWDPEVMAACAYQLADAMLKERAK